MSNRGGSDLLSDNSRTLLHCQPIAAYLTIAMEAFLRSIIALDILRYHRIEVRTAAEEYGDQDYLQSVERIVDEYKLRNPKSSLRPTKQIVGFLEQDIRFFIEMKSLVKKERGTENDNPKEFFPKPCDSVDFDSPIKALVPWGNFFFKSVHKVKQESALLKRKFRADNNDDVDEIDYATSPKKHYLDTTCLAMVVDDDELTPLFDPSRLVAL